jgi:hypothetical protein
MRRLPYELKLQRKDSQERIFLLREPEESDLQDIIDLQDTVHRGIGDRDIFHDTTPDEFRESLLLDKCFCVMYDEKLVGFTLMIVPRISYRNFGTDLGYEEAQMKKCVSMYTSFVHPDHCGYGLQRLFFELREQTGIEIGAAEALTTIAPGNDFSLRNACAMGYEIVKRTRLYGGLDRFILRKDLAE